MHVFRDVTSLIEHAAATTGWPAWPNGGGSKDGVSVRDRWKGNCSEDGRSSGPPVAESG